MPRIVPAVLHLRGHLLTFSPSHKVDWGLLAKSPWYTTAAKNSKQVGKLVASLITFLVSEGRYFFETFAFPKVSNLLILWEDLPFQACFITS